MNSLQIVRETIGEYHLFEPGDGVVAGISGGPDSVCLLQMLLRLADLYRIRIAVLHVHHGIRGEEADADARFVEEMAEAYGLPEKTVRVDLPGIREAEGGSLEELGRRERYRALEVYREELGFQKIAVGHHLEDSAETVLMNLARGSGIAGLAGIPPVNGRIIRPLIRLSRKEILSWLGAEGIPFRTDSTNRENEYTRNRVRNHVLPMLEREVNPAAAKHIAAAGGQIYQIRNYLQDQAGAAADGLLTKAGREGAFPVPEFLQVHPALQPLVLRDLLGRQDEEAARGLTEAHLRLMHHVLQNPAGFRGSVSLPGGWRLCRDRDQAFFVQGKGASEGEDGVSELPQLRMTVIELPEEKQLTDVVQEEGQLILRFSDGSSEILEQNSCIRWFDYDRIEEPVNLRYRETGDYLYVSTDGRMRQSLKALMINEKIPAEKRGRMPLVASGSEILWIPGLRTGERCRIGQETRRLLKLMVHGD